MLRDIKKNLSQFITIFLMVTIGIMVYTTMLSYSGAMQKSGDKYYKENNLFDLEAFGENFTKDDLNKIKKLDNPFWDVPLYVYIKFYPRRTNRDIDNPLKCLFDALTKNRIWKDDKQVKKLFICWHDKSCSKNNLEISICNDKSEYYKFLLDKIMEDEDAIIQPYITDKMRIK